jgi:hypothetical protein
MLWMALIAASETPNARIAVIAANEGAARWMSEFAFRLAGPTSCRLHFLERKIELPNGSTVVFLGVDRHEQRLIGTGATRFYDHATRITASECAYRPLGKSPGQEALEACAKTSEIASRFMLDHLPPERPWFSLAARVTMADIDRGRKKANGAMERARACRESFIATQCNQRPTCAENYHAALAEVDRLLRAYWKQEGI